MVAVLSVVMCLYEVWALLHTHLQYNMWHVGSVRMGCSDDYNYYL